MADETPKVAESPITSPETPVAVQPSRGIAATGVRKTKGKRGRPKKTASTTPVTASSLTRTTTRKIARGKAASKQKAAPRAPRMTLLNFLVNFSIVAAVFVTALAIQRIVPTEPVTTPKVEALPAQTTPVVPAPEAAAAAPQDPAVAEIPASMPAAAAPQEPAVGATPAAPAMTPTAAPVPAAEASKVAAADCIPPTAVTPRPAAAPQKSARTHKGMASQMTRTPQSHATPLNSGGSDDLDSEAARQAYMAKSKLATRIPAK